MKRMMSLILAVLMMLGISASWAYAEEKPAIGIVIQKENGAFLDMKEGILNTLAANGYCSSATTVASGCIATIAIDDVGIGENGPCLSQRHACGGNSPRGCQRGLCKN